MKRIKLLSILIFIFTVTALILTGCGASGYRSIKVFSIDGNVTINREEKTISASKNMKLKNDDVITVSSNSSTVLKLDSDKFVMAKENTTIKLLATGKKNNTKTRILVNDGGVIVEVKEKLKESESFEIASSNSVMAIRGTRIGLDVTKTTDTISTNFTTLTGKTEIMLLKDNMLNSTNLTECLSLTYESKLEDSKDINDMSNLIDTSTIGHISDNDLINVYNTEFREISTYEIDSIVDAVNKFERKLSEYINGTIKITDYPNKLEYGVNPKDYITVDKEYLGLNFYYSKDIKGDYLGFDEENPLAPGIWYCKAKSLDAYRSDPFEFEVVEKEIKFTNIPSEVDYKTNPKDVIKLDGSYKNIEYYYSDSLDGEYKLYDENDPLELGKWYFYAKCFGHISKTYDIEVVKIKAQFNFDITQKSYSGTASLDIALKDLNKVFSDELLSTIDPIVNETDYKYYISMKYTDSNYIDHYIYFDKDNDEKMLDFIFSGENSASFEIEYNLPYYYEVISSEDLTFNFKNSIDMDNSVILCRKRTYYQEEYKVVDICLNNYYALNDESKVKLYLKRVADFTGVITYEPLDSLSFNLEKDETLVVETFEFDGENKNKGYYEYEIDFSNSELIYTAKIECNSIFLTYNENGTMNVYFDIVYNGPSEDVLSYISLTTYDSEVDQTYMCLSSNKRFSVLEDLLVTTYRPTNASVVVKYNGVCYDLRSGDVDYTMINPYDPYYYEVNSSTNDNKTTISSTKTFIDMTSPVTVHADDNEYIVDSSYLKNNTIDNYIIDGLFDNLKVDATVYSYFAYTGNATHTQTFDIEDYPYDFYITDELFSIVKKQMKEKYGITVKGSNKFIFKGIEVNSLS